MWVPIAGEARHSRGARASYSRFPLADWPDIRKVLGNRPVPQSLNVPKSLYQSPSGTSGSWDFQLASSNRSSIETLRSLTRSRRWAHFSWEVLALNLGHGSAAQNQRAKLVHQAILIARIVVSKILLQSFEELALPILLALEAEPYERCYCFAHTGVNSLRIPFDLAGHRRWKTDRVPGFRFATSVETRLSGTDS